MFFIFYLFKFLSNCDFFCSKDNLLDISESDTPLAALVLAKITKIEMMTINIFPIRKN